MAAAGAVATAGRSRAAVTTAALSATGSVAAALAAATAVATATFAPLAAAGAVATAGRPRAAVTTAALAATGSVAASALSAATAVATATFAALSATTAVTTAALAAAAVAAALTATGTVTATAFTMLASAGCPRAAVTTAALAAAAAITAAFTALAATTAVAAALRTRFAAFKAAVAFAIAGAGAQAAVFAFAPFGARAAAALVRAVAGVAALAAAIRAAVAAKRTPAACAALVALRTVARAAAFAGRSRVAVALELARTGTAFTAEAPVRRTRIVARAAELKAASAVFAIIVQLAALFADRFEQALDDQRRVAAAAQLKAQAHHARAVVERVFFGGAHAQVRGCDDQGAIFALERKAGHAFDVELFGAHVFGGEHLVKQLALIAAVLQERAGQTQRAHRQQLGRSFGAVRRQRALVAGDHEAFLFRHRIAHGERRRAVPHMRLIRVQVDQANPRRRVVERARKVAGVLIEVIKDRKVLAKAARDATAALPITPMAADVALELLVTRRVKRRRPEQHALERVFVVALHQLARDPTLIVAQVAKALVVKVVDEAVLAHRFDVGAQDVHVAAAQRAHRDFECVAAAHRAVERDIGKAGRFDPQTLLADVHRAVLVLQAHVLRRHTLAVFQSAKCDVAGFDPGFFGKDAHDFGRRELLFRDAIDGVLTGCLDDVVFEQFPNVEVADALFESHDL